MVERFLDGFAPYVAGLTAASAVMFIAGLLATPLLITLLPENYFLRDPPRAHVRTATNRVRRALTLLLRNILGTVFLLAGVAMLVLPGQGLLSIFVGLTFLEFPGKRRWELALVSRKPVIGTINWIRERAGKNPLLLPAGE